MQVVTHLDAYHVGWAITTLTRKEYLGYMAHLAGLGLVDSREVQGHWDMSCSAIHSMQIECYQLLQSLKRTRQAGDNARQIAPYACVLLRSLL